MMLVGPGGARSTAAAGAAVKKEGSSGSVCPGAVEEAESGAVARRPEGGQEREGPSGSGYPDALEEAESGGATRARAGGEAKHGYAPASAGGGLCEGGPVGVDGEGRKRRWQPRQRK